MLAIAARLLNGRPPLIYEDGRQRRDFVSVYDVARACRRALERPDPAGRILNIGAGESISVLEIARELARVMGREEIAAQVTGTYRSRRHPQLLLGRWPGRRNDRLHARGEARRRHDGARRVARGRGLHRPRRRRGRRAGRARADGMTARALITGGAGFIGTNLADRLASDGERVIVFDNLSRPGVEDNLRWLTRRHAGAVDVEVAGDPTNWWAPNGACVEAMLRSCGLEIRARPGHEIWLCGPA